MLIAELLPRRISLFLNKLINSVLVSAFFQPTETKWIIPRIGRGAFFPHFRKSTTVINFAPTVAYKVSQNLSVGISAVLTYSEIQRDNQIDLSPLGFPGEGSLGLKGDGFGVV
jgi:hypothetical protein